MNPSLSNVSTDGAYSYGESAKHLTLGTDTQHRTAEYKSQSATETVENAPESSDEPIACCVSRSDHGGITTLLIPVAFVLLGIGSIWFGYSGTVPENLTRPELIERGLWCGGGFIGFGVLFGAGFLALWGFDRKIGLAAFDDRLEMVTKRKVTVIPWSEFGRVTVTHFSGGSGFAAKDLLSAKFGKRKSVTWSSHFEGDPDGVFQLFMTKCEYIVENPEGYRR